MQEEKWDIGRGACEEGRGETDIIISIGSAISVACEFYNEAVASIEGIECKYHRTSARFGAEMDYIMHVRVPTIVLLSIFDVQRTQLPDNNG